MQPGSINAILNISANAREAATLDDNGGNGQGTQDRPVILEDESDAPNLEANAVSTLVDDGPDPAFSFNKPLDPSSCEAWWDVEDGCFVANDLCSFPLLDQEALASMTPAKNQPTSRKHTTGSPENQMNRHSNNRTIPSTFEETTPHYLPFLLNKNIREGSEEENTSELEKELLLAFEKQDKSFLLMLAPAPGSPHPPRRSTSDQSERSFTGLAEPRNDYPVETPDESEAVQQGAEGLGEKLREEQEQEQEQEEDMVEVVEIQGEQPQHEEGEEMTREEEELDKLAIEEPQEEEEEEEYNGIDKDEDYSCDTGDEDDENLRPAKQRKLHLVQHNILQPYRPSATKKLSTCEVLTPESYVPQMSQSPSTSKKSLPIAEYQEWPFQGFLKRTIIENEITYNLEFKLPHILEYPSIPILSNLPSINSSKEISTEALNPHTAAYSKNDTSNEEKGLFMGKDPLCPPSPDPGGNTGAIFYEA